MLTMDSHSSIDIKESNSVDNVEQTQPNVLFWNNWLSTALVLPNTSHEYHTEYPNNYQKLVRNEIK